MSIYHSALKPEGVKLFFSSFWLGVVFFWWFFFFDLIILIQLLKLDFSSMKPPCLS